MHLRYAWGLVVVAACSSVESSPSGDAGSLPEAGAGDSSTPVDSSTPDATDDAPLDSPSDASADATVDATTDADAGPLVFAGNHVWSKRFASGSTDQQIVTDAAGNVYVAGRLLDPVSFGGTTLQVGAYIVKFTAAGAHVWSKSFPDETRVGSLALDPSGDVLLFGDFLGTVDFGGGVLTTAGRDVYLARFTSAGAYVSAKQFAATTSSTVARMLVAGATDAIIAHTGNGTIDFGEGPLTGTFLVRINRATGALVWSRKPVSGSVTLNGEALDSAGNTVVVGTYSTVDWGNGAMTTAGFFDVFVGKFDAAGAPVWTKGFGDTTLQEGYGVALDATDSIYLVGGAAGTVDFGNGVTIDSTHTNPIMVPYVAKLTAGGVATWAKVYPLAANIQGAVRRATVDAYGNVVITGGAQSGVDFGAGPVPNEPPVVNGPSHAFVAKLSGGAGAHLWSRGWTRAGFVLAADAAGNVLLGGAPRAPSAIDFGGGPLPPIGGADMALAKFGP